MPEQRTSIPPEGIKEKDRSNLAIANILVPMASFLLGLNVLSKTIWAGFKTAEAGYRIDQLMQPSTLPRILRYLATHPVE